MLTASAPISDYKWKSYQTKSDSYIFLVKKILAEALRTRVAYIKQQDMPNKTNAQMCLGADEKNLLAISTASDKVMPEPTRAVMAQIS